MTYNLGLLRQITVNTFHIQSYVSYSVQGCTCLCIFKPIVTHMATDVSILSYFVIQIINSQSTTLRYNVVLSDIPVGDPAFFLFVTGSNCHLEKF